MVTGVSAVSAYLCLTLLVSLLSTCGCCEVRRQPWPHMGSTPRRQYTSWHLCFRRWRWKVLARTPDMSKTQPRWKVLFPNTLAWRHVDRLLFEFRHECLVALRSDDTKVELILR